MIHPDAWPCNALSNHDFPRALTRFAAGADTGKRGKLLAMLLLTLRGTPFIYYGDEIGMTNAKLRRKELRDPVGVKYWPLHPGRDGERTPMQWNADQYAGFASVAPWLPVHANFAKCNVQAQTADPDSLFNFYRKLLALRREKTALREGDWLSLLDGSDGIMAYQRTAAGAQLVVLLNFLNQPTLANIPLTGNWQVVLSTQRNQSVPVNGLQIELAPYEATIMERMPH